VHPLGSYYMDISRSTVNKILKKLIVFETPPTNFGLQAIPKTFTDSYCGRYTKFTFSLQLSARAHTHTHTTDFN